LTSRRTNPRRPISLTRTPDKVKELQARITQLATEMAPPLLFMEAVRLTFYSPPVMLDLLQMFNLGD
jgi:hypothetical protein